MRWRTALTVGGPSAVALALSAAFWRRVPDPMPIHWDLYGEPNGWAPRAVGLLLLPAVGLFAGALTRWAMNQGKAGKLADAAALGTGGFMTAVHAMTVHAALHPPHQTSVGLIVALMGMLVAGLGLVMPHLSQNRFAGIRTPWTLADEVNWKLTHRFGAWTMGIGGLAAAASGLLLPDAPAFVVGLGSIVLGSLAPVVYSYALHRARSS